MLGELGGDLGDEVTGRERSVDGPYPIAEVLSLGADIGSEPIVAPHPRLEGPLRIRQVGEQLTGPRPPAVVVALELRGRNIQTARSAPTPWVANSSGSSADPSATTGPDIDALSRVMQAGLRPPVATRKTSICACSRLVLPTSSFLPATPEARPAPVNRLVSTGATRGGGPIDAAAQLAPANPKRLPIS